VFSPAEALPPGRGVWTLNSRGGREGIKVEEQASSLEQEGDGASRPWETDKSMTESPMGNYRYLLHT
jgi:hypothetical protein